MPIAELGRKTLLEIEVRERLKPEQLKIFHGLCSLANSMNQIARKLNQNRALSELSDKELDELTQCANTINKITDGFK